MADPIVDLAALDSDVRRAASRLEQLRHWLALGTREGREKARSFDPFDVRQTATRATYDALRKDTPSLLDVPLRDGLIRWVHELLQARVGLDLTLTDADEETELDPRLSASQLAELRAQDAARIAAGPGEAAPSKETPGHVAHTYREAFRAIVTAPNEGLSAAALTRASELSLRVGAVRKERRARRFEAARRLGLAHPWALASTLDVRALALALLDGTEPLSVAIFKRARKEADGPWRASSAIQLALGHGAQQGWPAHLGQRWLDEAFVAIAPRGVEIGPPPAPLGSATFLRAAMTWGFAWRTSGAPRSLPFALARDPYPVPAHRFGNAIAHVVAEPAFQRRALDLPSRTASAQARVLRTTMFLHARVVAARVMLSADETPPASLFEEITSRVFGAPLPASMRHAWPEPRAGEPAQLLGLLGTPAFLRDLVRRYDDDWFRNPKAGKHLTSLACGPAFDLEPLSAAATADLARAFEETIG